MVSIMIHIGICDDSEKDLKIIKNCIENMKLQDETVFNYYSSSRSMLENPIYNIYILDIDMPEMNGLQLAERLYKINPNAIIFFLTSHLEYATEGYKAHAIRYVYKPHMQEQLEEALRYSIEKCKFLQSKYITITHYRDCYRIMHADIIYVQRVGRQLEIHTTMDAPVIDNHGIGELFEMIDNPKFIFIERGCFVNTDYIYKVTKKSVQLTNGIELTISRRLLLDVKMKIADIWSREL